MNNKKIYFNIRPSSRERMWDTLKYAGDVCDVILPNIQQQSSIKAYKESNKKSFISKVKYEVSKKIINKQKIELTKSKVSDLVYMWGAFPKNSDKPFILELDNPYTLGYYHLENFKKNKNKIKENLDKAYKITYLSDTCRNHAIELYGKNIKEKSFINYPYMNENYKNNNRESGVVNFIFVGLNSRGKGGNELLEAFHHTKDENIKLTFISNISDNVKDKYKNDKRLNILPPQPREKILNEIYPKMDVMVFPSLYESFGVVLLEALSYGMGIITVDVYATPEIVKNNYNGKLLHHPILKPSILNGRQVVNCVDLRIKSFHRRYLENDEFYHGLYSELKNSIEEASVSYRVWQENSLKLFNDKFSPDIWKKNFRKILE